VVRRQTDDAKAAHARQHTNGLNQREQLGQDGSCESGMVRQQPLFVGRGVDDLRRLVTAQRS